MPKLRIQTKIHFIQTEIMVISGEEQKSAFEHKYKWRHLRKRDKMYMFGTHHYRRWDMRNRK